MTDWVLTIPKTTPWSEYQKELDACADDSLMHISYRLPFRPKAKHGERCYVVHDGFVRGYQIIRHVEFIEDGFVCEITGNYWREGWYIVRSGAFTRISPVEMKGFRGIRWFEHRKKELNK